MARVLVIDDDPVTREMLIELMENQGYDPSGADNGRVGLDLHREDPFDIVITDIIMPEMEGLETISQLRQVTPDLKIIAISGGGQVFSKDYLQIAGRIGAERTFKKPLDLKALVIAVKEMLAAGDK
jgi:DNA-binding NtrC family response regulator